MTSTDVIVPDLTGEDAKRLTSELFGLDASADELPSYVDRNFRMTAATGERFVLKIAHGGENEAVLDAQNAMMRHLHEHGVATPHALPAKNGKFRVTIPGPRGHEHSVRLVTYLEGTPLAKISPHPPELLEDLGRFLGRVDAALASFEAPALQRELRWNLADASMARAHLDALEGSRRERATRIFDRFEARVRPALSELPQSVIHNDANDYNILVHDGRIACLIDYGDSVHSARACELAICLTYAMLEKDDPIAAVVPVVRGYQSALELNERELELLIDLIYTRLCVSVTLSAHESRLHPENEYLNVTEEHAWQLLDQLDALDRAAIASSFIGAAHGDAQ